MIPLPDKFLSTPSARRATSRIGTLLGGETFLSTPSARRATWQGGYDYDLQLISIHALREEGDAAGIQFFAVSDTISIHALREEGDIAALVQ